VTDAPGQRSTTQCQSQADETASLQQSELPLFLGVAACQPRFVEHHTLEEGFDEKTLALLPCSRLQRGGDGEPPLECRQHTVKGHALLRTAGEIHATEQGLLFEARG